ncbi:hypothetical protein L7F22_040223 [Adiantum nelumboides]|nr:hypothetical protein [Adiantum nelumboides]
MMELRACNVQQHHSLAIARQAAVCPTAQPARSSLSPASTLSCCFLRSQSLFSPSLTKRSPIFVSNGTRWTAGQWLDTTAQIEVPVPLSVAWDLWTDRERVNRWMPWIHSIKVLKDRPELSKWCLKYNAFGQNFEFTWTAKNLQPIRNQKIHWRSVDGLPNRGTVRFYPRSSSTVGVELTISFEVPEVLVPLASSVSPLVQSIMQQDLERFAVIAKEQNLKVPVK